MSNRINEELGFGVAIAPASLATATESTKVWIDMAGADEVCFAVTRAAMTSTKEVEYKVYGSTAADHTDAAVVKTFEETIATGDAGTVYTISVPASHTYRYLAITAKHNEGSGVVFSGAALKRLLATEANGQII